MVWDGSNLVNALQVINRHLFRHIHKHIRPVNVDRASFSAEGEHQGSNGSPAAITRAAPALTARLQLQD